MSDILYTPFTRDSTMQELVETWKAPYFRLYKILRTLKMRPHRGDNNTMVLTPAQQQQLADVLNARGLRPLDLEHHSAEVLHAELDRLTHNYERLSAAHEVTAGLARTYREHLDWLTPVAENRLASIEAVLGLSGNPDFRASLQAVKVLANPVEAPLQDVQEAGLFTMAVAGILARRFEADEEAYTRLVQACAQQPLGLLRGELIGSLFTLGALVEAALTVHRARHEEDSAEVQNLEHSLITVLGQLKVWVNDSMPWLGERVRPLADPQGAGDRAPTPA